MTSSSGGGQEIPGRSKGCLVTITGSIALVVMAIPVALVRWWRARRRGADLRTSLDVQPFPIEGERARRKFDLTVYVPRVIESGFHRVLTDVVVRVAEELRLPDDVYHLVYRLPWEDEPVVIAVGPQIQELGERLSLALSQASLEGRTALWLTLGRSRRLAEVVDPIHYDPETEGQPEALLASSRPRWAMATSWERIGPSLVFRMVLVVGQEANDRILALLQSITL